MDNVAWSGFTENVVGHGASHESHGKRLAETTGCRDLLTCCFIFKARSYLEPAESLPRQHDVLYGLQKLAMVIAISTPG